MNKKIALIMSAITLLLFSACTSRETFNKEVKENKNQVSLKV